MHVIDLFGEVAATQVIPIIQSFCSRMIYVKVLDLNILKSKLFESIFFIFSSLYYGMNQKRIKDDSKLVKEGVRYNFSNLKKKNVKKVHSNFPGTVTQEIGFNISNQEDINLSHDSGEVEITVSISLILLTYLGYSVTRWSDAFLIPTQRQNFRKRLVVMFLHSRLWIKMITLVHTRVKLSNCNACYFFPFNINVAVSAI